jgi:hypothetical protein
VSRRGPARLLLTGASVRAFAASCRRSPLARNLFPGGVVALDYFADTDLQDDEGVVRLAVGRDVEGDRTTAGLGRAALALGSGPHRWDACAFTGGLENRPGLLRLLSRRGTLLGPEPGAIHAVRRAETLFGFLVSEGIPCARLAPGGRAPDDARPGTWLVKPRGAAGGRGVREARAGEAGAPGEFVQERLEGACGSAAFVADGRDAVLLGTSRQIVGGEPLGQILGAPPFRYAGSVVGPPGHFLDAAAEARLAEAGRRIARRFTLRGLFGLDVIRVRREAHVIEVNPRWTASMELIEETRGGDGAGTPGRSLFDLHLRVLQEPIDRIGCAKAPARWVAKGILWADRPMTAPDPEVLAALGARDRPRRSERFLPGTPVCTLVVEGSDAQACRRALRARAHDARKSL